MASSKEIIIKEGKNHLEFSSQLPKALSKCSPNFYMMSYSWYLCLSLKNGHSSENECVQCYCLEIQCHEKMFFKAIRIDFRVGFVTEENFSLGKGSIEVRESPCRLWEIPQETLQSKLPPSCIDTLNKVIKFELRFDLSHGPAFEILPATPWITKCDKCVQTSSSLNFSSDLSMEGLCKDFADLFNTGLDKDVLIRCGMYRIKAHKLVLSTRSAVFKAMLQSNMQEARSGVIHIQDLDAGYIHDFVRYLYSDSVLEMNFNKAVALYQAGDKYAIQSLVLHCSEYLAGNLSQENAFQCFALADAHSDKKLQREVINYILQQKIYLQEYRWLPFCEKYPKAAFEVYKLLHKKL